MSYAVKHVKVGILTLVLTEHSTGADGGMHYEVGFTLPPDAWREVLDHLRFDYEDGFADEDVPGEPTNKWFSVTEYDPLANVEREITIFRGWGE